MRTKRGILKAIRWMAYVVGLRMLFLSYTWSLLRYLFPGIAIITIAMLCILYIQKPLRKMVRTRHYQRWKYRVIGLNLMAAFIWGISVGCCYLGTYLEQLEHRARSATIIQYEEQDNTYSIQLQSNQEFRILQLTDLHIGGSFITLEADQKAFEAMYDLIQFSNPDLIIITGDLVYPTPYPTLSLNNQVPFEMICIFMEKMGVPWAFTYGNHDTEVGATHSALEIESMLKQYAWSEGGSHLYSWTAPVESGRSNQIIQIKNQDGTIRQALYLLDSNAYEDEFQKQYDTIHSDQVQWYCESLDRMNERYHRTVPTMLFYHIPGKEFADAAQKLEEGSNEVTYCFGENKEPNQDIGSSQKDSGLFEQVVAKQSTKAIFVGHDHLNTTSLMYQGVRLTFGSSIDYIAYANIQDSVFQRGGTLITIDENGDFDIRKLNLEQIRTN